MIRNPATAPAGDPRRKAPPRSQHPLFPLLATLSITAVACSDTVPPPAAPATAAPVTAGSTAKTPASVASAASTQLPASAPPDVPDLVLPAPLEEPLAPLSRSFILVPVPGIKDTLVSISGRSANDLWLVSGEVLKTGYREELGIVYQFDGKRTKSYGHPCDAANWGDAVAGAGTIVATGYRAWSRGVWPFFRAVLGADGKWQCDYHDHGFAMGLTRAGGGLVWQLSCSSDCHLDVAGGPSVPFPSFHYSADRKADSQAPADALWMRSADDGWMVHEGEDGNRWLFRYNGVAWAPKIPLPYSVSVVDLWADDEGQAWLALRRGGKDDDPATILARTTDGRALAAMPVPASFAIRTIRGSGAKDIWLLGDGRKVYQFDGKQLRQGVAPFPVADAWGSPDGDVWFAGGSEAVDDKPRKPMLAHLSSAGVKK